jgi:hypothetical protein
VGDRSSAWSYRRAPGHRRGILLSLARVAGETRRLLFTAFSNRFWSEGWNQPTASLPVVIFTYAVSPYEDWHRQAWAAALVLLCLVLGSNVLARLSSSAEPAGSAAHDHDRALDPDATHTHDGPLGTEDARRALSRWRRTS